MLGVLDRMWLRVSLLTAGFAISGLGQISPGPLSSAHQQLEGATQCTACHSFGIGERALKCLDCHTEIAERLAADAGYHSREYRAAANQLDCARCHLEHNGRDFAITRFEKTGFDHARRTGFDLRGAHATAECSSCHKASLVQPGVRASIKIKDLNRTFLGLPTQCADCHEDPHGSQLGAACSTCHNEVEWTPAPYFNHNSTRYPLSGKHRGVSCSGCHTPAGGSEVPRYKGLPFANCDGCHADPHQGAFASELFSSSDGSCASCHIESGWNLLRSDAGFDHAQTEFPLNGKHAEVACSSCHMDSNFGRPIEFRLCANCHEDVHGGQFEAREAGSDCSSCHNETAFTPSLFTKETHRQSAFVLEGAHGDLECSTCHQPPGADAKYILGTLTCQSCHQDPHAGEFAEAPLGNRCETCHTQQEFHTSTFSLTRHQETQFALTGAHLAVVCRECHTPLPAAVTPSNPGLLAKIPDISTAVARRYHFPDQSCAGCHADPHRLPEAVGLTCETCHNTDQWRRLRLFDHSTTGFQLDGAHQQASCASCHLPRPSVVTAEAVATVDFYATPRQCFQCHEDVHGGQFMSPGAEADCATCHSITTWSAGSFDHRTTRFPLDGAHQEVGCAQCHNQFVPVDGRQVRLYRGVPLECEGCHAGGAPAREEVQAARF